MVVKNNKGTVLVIAVVAMSIMIIIGFICLRIYSNQSILDTRDVVKQRLYYSAIGSVEAMKGYLSKKVAENIQSRKGQQNSDGSPILQGDITNDKIDEGFLASVTNGSYYALTGLFGSYGGETNVFDASMHPPIVIEYVRLKRFKNASSIPTGDFYAGHEVKLTNPFNGIGYNSTSHKKGYVIEAKAKTKFNTALHSTNNMYVVAKFYFYTEHDATADGTDARPYRQVIHCVGWRIEN